MSLQYSIKVAGRTIC